MRTSTLRNPIAIVTGGSRGIGRAVVERLHRDGYGILFTHSNSDADARVIEKALNTAHRPCRALRIDVADNDAAVQVFDAAESLGAVIALINNAGITGGIGALETLDDETLQRVIAVNLLAPIRLCREAARRWKSRSYRSTIINISSIAARTGSPNEYVAYAASKGALNTLTVGLARELAASHIHVNAVSPGTIDTDIHARAGMPERAWRVAERVPMRRPGQADEIANAVAWLVSDKASYVTGTILDVTGGL
jgi:NAD(P)-dependent dehydrogenase (short-subunit alcohol dehydrogenase family)